MAQANENVFADTEYIVGDEIETPPTAEVEEELVVEVSDDTPERDRDHNPLPKNISDELEELDNSAEV